VEGSNLVEYHVVLTEDINGCSQNVHANIGGSEAYDTAPFQILLYLTLNFLSNSTLCCSYNLKFYSGVHLLVPLLISFDSFIPA